MRDIGVAGAFAIGGLVVTLAALRRPPMVLMRPPHLRPNYRGAHVAGTMGIVLCLPVAVSGGAVAVMAWRGLCCLLELLAVGTSAAGLAMGSVGLWDDLTSAGRGGGFLGHLRALLRGRFTTGGVKATVGAAVGLAAAYLLGWRGAWIVAAGAVVALAANGTNLFDVRPGRACKVWLVAAAGLMLTRPPTGPLAVLAATVGGVVAFLPADLDERVMLGDTGSNLLGAVWGCVAIVSVDGHALLFLLGALAALNAASEFVSFTRVIEAVPPLRLLDALGRRP